MKSPVMKIVADAAILISAFCAVHEGLSAFGIDLTAPDQLLGGVADIVRYVFGAAGLITFFMFFTCGCGLGSCSRK